MMLAKQTAILLIMPAMVITASAQYNDLALYSNGLIYDPPTMGRLKHTVDSLNLKFKQCPLTTTYYSLKQAVGHDIRLDTGDIKAALRDIQNGITYRAFIEKYPFAQVDSNTLILETTDKNYLKKNTYVYTNINQIDGNEFWITVDCVGITESVYRGLRGKIGCWIFAYSERYPGDTSRYFREKIRAIYLETPAVARTIPEPYARDILYSDCMVDTNSNIFLENAKNNMAFWVSSQETAIKTNNVKYNRFVKYLEQQTGATIQRNELMDENISAWYYRDSLRMAYIEDTLSKRSLFRTLLTDAVSEALREKYITSDEFEYYTARYYSKEAALQMKRSRIVMGSCSMDASPRLHIMEIGQLAAETANWQVFLRAHLDIMNDYAARTANSNFATRDRNTYIRELEELNIDVQNLLLGIVLSISNEAKGHYFGSPNRLGRAFAETKYRASLERKVLLMIADEQLDDYNRYTLYMLLGEYLYYLPEKTERIKGLSLLEQAHKTLPAYLQQKIKLDNHKANIEEGAQL